MSETPPAKKSITVLAPVYSMGQGPRLSKLANVLLSLGLEVEHWGWKRAANEETSYAGIQTQILLEGGGYANRGLRKYYVLWVRRLIGKLRRDGKGRNLYCVGFLSAFSACVTRRTTKCAYFYDNNDNFSLSFNWPGPVRKLLQRLDRYVVKHAAIHLVPSQYRWPEGGSNLRILPNTPSTRAVNAAKQIVAKKGITREPELTLYVNGRLDSGRGPKQLLQAFDKVPMDKVKLIVAGELVTEEAKALSQLPCATYLGTLSNEEALAWYWGAHVLFTFYDPSVPINRLAEPNKWGDCVIANTPFIVNSEVETAAPYKAKNACFHVPYEDTDALAALLSDLADHPEKVSAVQERLKEFSAPPWEEGMKALMEEFLHLPGA